MGQTVHAEIASVIGSDLGTPQQLGWLKQTVGVIRPDSPRGPPTWVFHFRTCSEVAVVGTLVCFPTMRACVCFHLHLFLHRFHPHNLCWRWMIACCCVMQYVFSSRELLPCIPYLRIPPHKISLSGVMSVFPITVVSEMSSPTFERGVLHVKSGGVHFFVVHLNAHSAVSRVLEAQALASLVSAVKSEPAVVMGDLNTLSSLDAETHLKEGLLDFLLKSSEVMLRKKLLIDEKLAYAPMDVLLKSGLSDTCSLSSSGANNCGATSPTGIPPDQVGYGCVGIVYD